MPDSFGPVWANPQASKSDYKKVRALHSHENFACRTQRSLTNVNLNSSKLVLSSKDASYVFAQILLIALFDDNFVTNLCPFVIPSSFYKCRNFFFDSQFDQETRQIAASVIFVLRRIFIPLEESLNTFLWKGCVCSSHLKKEETLWAVKRIEAIFEIGFRLFVLHSDLIK